MQPTVKIVDIIFHKMRGGEEPSLLIRWYHLRLLIAYLSRKRDNSIRFFCYHPLNCNDQVFQTRQATE